jgi:hypothetical protein
VKQSLIAVLLFSAFTFSQDFSKPSVSVKVLPPEAIPVGSCKEDLFGYLGVPRNGKTETQLTDEQLGEYIRVRLSQGYSVVLYPQASGKIFAIATCESDKH